MLAGLSLAPELLARHAPVRHIGASGLQYWCCQVSWMVLLEQSDTGRLLCWCATACIADSKPWCNIVCRVDAERAHAAHAAAWSHHTHHPGAKPRHPLAYYVQQPMLLESAIGSS